MRFRRRLPVVPTRVRTSGAEAPDLLLTLYRRAKALRPAKSDYRRERSKLRLYATQEMFATHNVHHQQFRHKNFGDAYRVPMVALLQLLSAFCCFSSLLSFWLPWIYSPFPFFMEFRNGVLLQLIECIESTQNEVKRKMIESEAHKVAPKSLRPLRMKKITHCAGKNHARHRNFIVFVVFRTAFSCARRKQHHDGAATARREPSPSIPPSIMNDGFGSNESLGGAFLWPTMS